MGWDGMGAGEEGTSEPAGGFKCGSGKAPPAQPSRSAPPSLAVRPLRACAALPRGRPASPSPPRAAESLQPVGRGGQAAASASPDGRTDGRSHAPHRALKPPAAPRPARRCPAAPARRQAGGTPQARAPEVSIRGGGHGGGDGHATTKRPARPFRLLPRPFRRGFPQQPKRGWAGVKRRPPDTCRGPAGSGGSHSFHSQEDFSSPLPAPVSFPTECVSIGALLWRSAVGGNSKKNRFAALENFSNGFSLSPVSCQQQPLRGNPSYFLSSF